MIDALPLLLGSDEYQISRSVRLRSSASAYFNRTPASAASNGQRWTYSGWVKRGALGAVASLLSADAGGGTSGGLYFDTDNTLKFGTGATLHKTSAAVFRDPSAWYHIVVVADSTQATGANRLLLYVNGVPQTWTSGTDPTLNGIWLIGKQSTLQGIGFAVGSAASTYFDGYLTEINFIDGQSLPAGLSNWAQAFGETDIATGVWKPKKYTGTYGNNGFYLNFSDPSAATAAAIGADRSGNGNNYTPNNITLSPTTSASYDSMLDVPTPWADGGNGRGNYATLNPLDKALSGTVLSNGNLTFNSGGGGASFTAARVTMSLSAADLSYWECVIPTTLTYWNAGVMRGDQNIYVGAGAAIGDAPGYPDSVGYRSNQSKVYQNGTVLATDSACSAGNIVMFAYNASTRKLWVGRQGTWLNSGNPAAGTGEVATLSASYTWFAAANDATSQVNEFNFGQRPFAYTPPTGFRALNTQNLPTPTILKGNQFFDATTYTGTGVAQNIVNSGGFQPDLVWLKARSFGYSHRLADSARGATNYIDTSQTAAEFTDAGNSVSSFNTNGFGVGTYVSANNNTTTYVGWQWKEGATQGFDIVLYTGNSTASRSINHSLGVTPSMIFVKNRTTAQNNPVAHTSLAVGNLLLFDTTGASTAAGTRLRLGNSTAFTVGDAADYTITNQTGNNYVAYLFAEVAGFSRFGSYTGNGSADGPFVFCGFRPRWIMTKLSSAAGGGWWIYDTARDTFNATNDLLQANLVNASATGLPFDILSNGFKIRTSNVGANTSGATFIFAAFAENPFKYSLAR